MDREILASTEYFGTKFVIFRAKKICVNRRFKTSGLQMSLILTATRPLLGFGMTFALCLLCCTVHTVPNDGEEKRNAANDKSGFYENCSSSFEADINKISTLFSLSVICATKYIYI